MDQILNILNHSRTSCVTVISKSGNSKGSGAFIGDGNILTCFHVIGDLKIQGNSINSSIYPDLQIILPSGEVVDASVVSVPTSSDVNPLLYDFAILRLKNRPKNNYSVLTLATENEKLEVGDDVVFSGYPLATPGMVTHRGMVSGTDAAFSLIFVQASINKGNSGGALLNNQGHVVGIISMREGGISKALQELRIEIDKTSSFGKVEFMEIDPLQATKAIIQTLDQYISTGIGYARSVKYVREYLEKNPDLLTKGKF